MYPNKRLTDWAEWNAVKEMFIVASVNPIRGMWRPWEISLWHPVATFCNCTGTGFSENVLPLAHLERYFINGTFLYLPAKLWQNKKKDKWMLSAVTLLMLMYRLVIVSVVCNECGFVWVNWVIWTGRKWPSLFTVSSYETSEHSTPGQSGGQETRRQMWLLSFLLVINFFPVPHFLLGLLVIITTIRVFMWSLNTFHCNGINV